MDRQTTRKVVASHVVDLEAWKELHPIDTCPTSSRWRICCNGGLRRLDLKAAAVAGGAVRVQR